MPPHVIYRGDHPTSAYRNDAGEYIGNFWCFGCDSEAPDGVYRVGKGWCCEACKKAAKAPRKPQAATASDELGNLFARLIAEGEV